MHPSLIACLSLETQQLTDLVDERARNLLNSAMALLPHQEQEAYFEAIHRVPHLVKLESNPSSFLRREDYNPYAAALRLARWWTYRKQIFGTKAFLPLDLSSTGALEQDDIEVLASGAFAVLPETNSGHLVLFVDRRRFPKSMEWNPRRVLFFLFAVMSRHEMTQSEGFVATYLFVPQKFINLTNTGLYEEITNQISKIQPLRLKETHLVSIAQGTENALMPLKVNNWGHLTGNNLVTHLASWEHEVPGKLASAGFRPECLPKCLGGTWSYHNFQLWLLHHKASPVLAARVVLEVEPDDTLATSDARSEFEESPQTKQVGIAAPAEAIQMLPVEASAGEWNESCDFKRSTKEHRQLESNSLKLPATASAKQPSLSSGLIRTGVMEAMELVPLSDKAAYLLAMEKCAHLVMTESDPERFRRVTETAMAAARHLATYWRTRREIFGEEAFLLPLNQTGEGALSKKDITLLSSGVLRQLPNDNDGLPVLFIDMNEAFSVSRYSQESFMRCLFYMFSVACENEKSQESGKGFVLLCRIAHLSVDRMVDRESIELGTSVFPGHLRAFHVLCCRAPQSEHVNAEVPSDVEQRVAKKVAALGTSIENKTVIHAVDSREEYPMRLEAYGLFQKGLPKIIGGSLNALSLVEWQELRVRYEWSIPISAASREYAASLGIPTAKPPPDTDDEDRRERQRRMNVIHSRRKRGKDDLDLEMLQETSAELVAKKAKLQEDGSFLERALKEALKLISGVSQTESDW